VLSPLPELPAGATFRAGDGGSSLGWPEQPLRFIPLMYDDDAIKTVAHRSQLCDGVVSTRSAIASSRPRSSAVNVAMHRSHQPR